MFAAKAQLLTQGLAKKSYAYGNPFSGMPPGTDLAMTSGAAASGHYIDSGNMRETNSTATNGTKYSAYVLSETLSTNVFEVNVGNANLSTTDRGIGPGIFSSDLTKGVFVIICGNTINCRIHSWESGAVNVVGTTSGSFSTSSSDIIKLIPTISAGVVTWNVYRNSTLLGATWTDSAHLLDIPGNRAGACFRRTYSGGHFPSPGVKSIAAFDI